jgi:RNA polymerase sigma-70 factor (ECF subfamily)
LGKETAMDDRGIEALFCIGSEQAISETQAKYGALLHRIALRLTGDPSAAEECVSDALLRAWELLRGREPTGNLLPLLGRLVRGYAIDRCRKEGAKKRSAALVELTQELSEVIPWNGSVEGEAEANELASLISGFVGSLPKDKQILFIRRYWYCDTVAETARALGSPESRVRSRLFRIRKELKRYLEERGYEV